MAHGVAVKHARLDESDGIRYVFELPATVVWELCAVLDPGNVWEGVATEMPDICDVDIDACRRLRSGERPTEALLRIWGAGGYRILDLYKVLYRLKYVRCMQILLPYVDKKYHHYALSIGSATGGVADIAPATPRRRVGVDGTFCPAAVASHSESRSAAPAAGTSSVVVYSSKRAGYALHVVGELQYAGVSSGAHHDSAAAAAAVGASEGAEALMAGLQSTPAVKYADILIATDNFGEKNVLGRGGYGVVYRGVWQHLEVAVKRIQVRRDNSLAQQKESVRQSLQELRTLAKFRHENVLSLYGYSMDGAEPCLIYQFMANGSLEDRLLCRNGTKPLTWPMKAAICRGVACGLHFLHSIANQPIIHGDVKSANILLDRHMEPKLGDFGLSRDGQMELSGDEKTPMIASHVKGTLAYLPPEFTTSKIITTKLDVYSFGVVLLEVAIGQRAYSNSRIPPNLVDYLASKTGADARRRWDELSDRRTPPTISPEESREIFVRLLRQGELCLQRDRFLRPSFAEIFGQLSASDGS